MEHHFFWILMNLFKLKVITHHFKLPVFKLALCRITIIRYYLTEAWLHSCNVHTQWSNFNWSAVVGYAANPDSDHYLHVFIFLVCIHHQDIPLSKWPLPVKHKIPVLLVIYRLCLAMWERKTLQIPKVYRASNIACFACYFCSCERRITLKWKQCIILDVCKRSI